MILHRELIPLLSNNKRVKSLMPLTMFLKPSEILDQLAVLEDSEEIFFNYYNCSKGENYLREHFLFYSQYQNVLKILNDNHFHTTQKRIANDYESKKLVNIDLIPECLDYLMYNDDPYIFHYPNSKRNKIIAQKQGLIILGNKKGNYEERFHRFRVVINEQPVSYDMHSIKIGKQLFKLEVNS